MTLCPLDIRIDALTMSPLPVSLTTLKTHAAVDGSDLDTIISETWLESVILEAEGRMHRTIFSRGHRWVLKDFPRTGRREIRLPRGKTQSVESIVYHSNGSTTTLTGPSSGSPAGTDWREDLRGDDGAALMPPLGGDWPSVDDDHPAPVVINFTAGWASADVPKQIVAALAHLHADRVDIRNTLGVPAEGSRLAYAEALLSDWALVRWY